MKHLVSKDKHLRERFFTAEYVHRILLSLFRNQRLSPSVRFTLNGELGFLTRNSGTTRIRNRCTMTGRGRSVFRRFRLSRMVFRSRALLGKIPGIRKASW